MKRFTYHPEERKQNQRNADHVNAYIDRVVVVGAVLHGTISNNCRSNPPAVVDG